MKFSSVSIDHNTFPSGTLLRIHKVGGAEYRVNGMVVDVPEFGIIAQEGQEITIRYANGDTEVLKIRASTVSPHLQKQLPKPKVFNTPEYRNCLPKSKRRW